MIIVIIISVIIIVTVIIITVTGIIIIIIIIIIIKMNVFSKTHRKRGKFKLFFSEKNSKFIWTSVHIQHLEFCVYNSDVSCACWGCWVKVIGLS